MACTLRLLILACAVVSKAEDIKDFEFESDADEVMIAQESRQYQTIVKPPVRIIKPLGVTNSHRPQYNIDSLEHYELDDFIQPTRRSLVKNYKSSTTLRAQERMANDAVKRAMDRKDHAGKFAQILPIIRAMSSSQRLALASLVASQVRSMFGNTNTTDLMLPILLDMANLVRRAIRPGKETREVKQPQILRRSYTEDQTLDDEFFDVGVEPAPTPTRQELQRTRRIIPQNQKNTITNTNTDKTKTIVDNSTTVHHDKNATRPLSTTIENTSPPATTKSKDNESRALDNSTLDLMADSTNQTLATDLPVAEKLRALNRYAVSSVAAHTLPNHTPTIPLRPDGPQQNPRLELSAGGDQHRPESCQLLIKLKAIVQSIRRNKAAAGALLADFKDPGEGALDGVTAAQESKYTAEHYLVSTNRRGDTANRDFASAGEAGFMCPSTVKYARPQRARATSGHWKYIVNTGEHTQTLRLEKKPKESCTYLTDNFQSKCVQVYNYHRLLTWDQQNGLHMDIFKVPTCCSCHIEGYSVNFPPVGHRIHETSSEHFPGEDLSSEQGNLAFEAVQSSMQRPTVSKSPPFSHKNPEGFPPFDNNQNLISGVPFSKGKINTEENDQSNPMDSYGNSYFPDSFNQASSVRNVRRPSSARSPVSSNSDSMTLPSYLEPPTPSATNTFSFVKEKTNKYKSNPNQFKRGAFRPSRRPIRKKIGGPEDLMSSGSSAVESYSSTNLDTMEDFNDYIEESQMGQASVLNNQKIVTIAPKLHSMTTEKTSTTMRSQEINNSANENFMSSGKRINYNYHPIIDFFGADGKEVEDESIDREDSEASFVPSLESEWKPIDHLPSRNLHISNLVARKKHR
ncbi:Protein spaetzle [Operophtera brumata]|uniref:Protein spaetzle n=1 Tax=Operophtera brumata TaxID=104452 RepID=A0A0L7L4C6_OPEBR|nr:Protein spaetzle [Operophtera brumata]